MEMTLASKDRRESRMDVYLFQGLLTRVRFHVQYFSDVRFCLHESAQFVNTVIILVGQRIASFIESHWKSDMESRTISHVYMAPNRYKWFQKSFFDVTFQSFCHFVISLDSCYDVKLKSMARMLFWMHLGSANTRLFAAEQINKMVIARTMQWRNRQWKLNVGLTRPSTRQPKASISNTFPVGPKCGYTSRLGVT